MEQSAASVAVAVMRRFSVVRKGSEDIFDVLYITRDSDSGTIFVCINEQNKLERIVFDEVEEVRNVEKIATS
jgi:hypothetical protein